MAEIAEEDYDQTGSLVEKLGDKIEL